MIETRSRLTTVERPTHRAGEEPAPEAVRGRCPMCGQPVVSNHYYVGGGGYIIVWECWGALAEQPSCDYRKIL